MFRGGGEHSVLPCVNPCTFVLWVNCKEKCQISIFPANTTSRKLDILNRYQINDTYLSDMHNSHLK